MKIGIIQGSSQKDKNAILERNVKRAVQEKGWDVINFGIFSDSTMAYSYVQIALCISLLLESKAVDFIVTGCSSGQGMMLACNNFPGVMCGYVTNVSDAYLFGRINAGNAVSYALGLNFGWAAEINFYNTMRALFEEPFGCGYPKEEERKRRDAELLKNIHAQSKKDITEILNTLDQEYVRSVLDYSVVYDYIMKYGKNEKLKFEMERIRRKVDNCRIL